MDDIKSDDLKCVGQSAEKIDGMSLATGREKFTDDFRLDDPLHIALLYSPHAHADILHIDTSQAEKTEGVVDILHNGNVPDQLHTTAGQGYPEPSPYDTRLFDRKVRFVGDRVALVAAETLQAARAAVKKIKVDYRVREAVFDPQKATAPGAPCIHEDDEHALLPVGYQPEQNIAGAVEIAVGDIDQGFQDADFIEEQIYQTQYISHCAMEPHAVRVFFDARGRLVIVSSTQVPFHARRIVSRVLSIPVSRIRVIKPRVGGAFGGKQEVFLEPLAALVAWRNQRPIRWVLSRKEVFVSARTRHPMRIRMKTGVDRKGAITALEMDCLMNAGAYGPHSPTVIYNAGSRVLAFFNKIENIHFKARAAYTNLPIGGAFRGYGAPQGFFAFNRHMDMLAAKTGQDPVDFFKKWHIREQETSPVFEALGEGTEGVPQIVRSCRLDECIDRGADAIGWSAKRGRRIKSAGGFVRGVGMAVAMQGSGIPNVDMGSASIKMNDDGSFNLLVGATDLGTGSDTVLAQIAAEVLTVPVEKIIVLSSDTDLTPFDVGAYADSTTYISGKAVEKCARKVAEQIVGVASTLLDSPETALDLEAGRVLARRQNRAVSFEDIALSSLYASDQFQIQAQASHVAPESPPPFIAQFAEVEVDTKTGKVRVVQFVSAVDCGQPVNPKLVEGQVEGAVVQGIGYALCEDYHFDTRGRMTNNRFWDYMVYTAADIPKIKTITVSSSEPTGPFGAKSVGEIAIDGPAPAIGNAIYDAVGAQLFELPFTPEKVLRESNQLKNL